jgi:hypothetical protein
MAVSDRTTQRLTTGYADTKPLPPPKLHKITGPDAADAVKVGWSVFVGAELDGGGGRRG